MNLINRALIYRVGSSILGLAILWILTGKLSYALKLEAVLFFTHTMYYMAFHKIGRVVRTRRLQEAARISRINPAFHIWADASRERWREIL